MTRKKIWITGIAGFLGSHLAEALNKEWHEVWGNDNLSGGDRANVPPCCILVESDCRDQANMRRLFEVVKPDIVYHCAALAHERLSNFSPSVIFDNVAGASVATFSAAIASGVKRIVFLSSMARYGQGSRNFQPPFAEYYPTAPVDPYGMAKVVAEQVLACMCKTHEVEYQIAVPHNIIGPRQRYVDPFRNVVSIFMNRLKQGHAGLIDGDGYQKRCFSPVQDILPCLVKLGLDGGLPNGEVWNIGPDNGEITINELYKSILEVSGLSLQPVYGPSIPNAVKDAFCTADKARARLGYESRITLGECLRGMWKDIPAGGKPFEYPDRPLEIEKNAPRAWKDQLI